MSIVNKEPPRESTGRPLRTSDLASAASRSDAREEADDREERIEANEVAGNEITDHDITPHEVAANDATPDEVTPTEVQSKDVMPPGSKPRDLRAQGAGDRERLEPLFSPDRAEEYRLRWVAVQSSFVDDPREAVERGDELVAEVMKSLAETFATERDKLENQLSQTGEASTETLRVALRRYRSFFERLLAL